MISRSFENSRVYFKLEEFDWDGMCYGTWFAVGHSKNQNQENTITYDQINNVLSCEPCSEKLLITNILGLELECSKPPISLSRYKAGMYIVTNESNSQRLKVFVHN